MGRKNCGATLFVRPPHQDVVELREKLLTHIYARRTFSVRVGKMKWSESKDKRKQLDDEAGKNTNTYIPRVETMRKHNRIQSDFTRSRFKGRPKKNT